MVYRRLAPQGHSGTLKDVATAWIQGMVPKLMKTLLLAKKEAERSSQRLHPSALLEAEIRLGLTSPMLETAYCLDRLLELT